MNFADDEDEDSTNIGITKYPCMPSLVALQQMRNRLHLARLGRKLMKWTALATGKELRKTSAEIIQVVEDYSEKISNAYILLARCRYFYPSLNEIVINNTPRAASVTVERSYRSASGIKLLIFEVEETGVVPYPHLGIGQGGEMVNEAKAAWLELLKQMILLLQLKESFITIEGANKGATKKSNVLGKIVIPRISMSIVYILSELEEREREEFFRLKRFKEMKAKKYKSGDLHICCWCLAMFESDEDIVESMCEACAKAGREKSKRRQLNLKLVPCENANINNEEHQKRIQHLICHIDDIINMTNQCKSDGIVLPTLDKFIETCSQVKVQIEDYAIEPSVCDICSKSLTNAKVLTAPCTPMAPSMVKKLAKMPSSEKFLPPICGPEKQKTDAIASKLSVKSDNMDLGYFEQKFKEIVKVTRLQNRDGTISEEKQVITIKTERKTPQSVGHINDQVNSCSGSLYGRFGSNQNENYNDQKSDPRETKSENITRTYEKDEPKVRKCMSTTTTNMKSQNGPINCDNITCSAMKSTNIMSRTNLSPRSKSDVYVCGRDLLSNPVSKTASIQTCCKTLVINKPIDIKGTCCLSADFESNTKDTFTEPIWRDVGTSTTDLCIHFKSGFGSCYTIKIVANEPKKLNIDKSKESFLNFFDANKEIRTISEEGKRICERCLSKLKSRQSSPKTRIQTCSSFESNKVAKEFSCRKCEEELKQTDKCSVCEGRVQKKPQKNYIDTQKLEKRTFCPSCKKSLFPSPSSNNCSDTSNENICRPSKPMHDLKKHTYYIAPPKETDSNSDLSGCCSVVHSTNSKLSCCAKLREVRGFIHQKCPPAKAQRSGLSVVPKTSFKSERSSCGTESRDQISTKPSEISVKSATTSCNRTMKDQCTNTKRSDRYDIRPLRRPLKRLRTSGGCVCKSDTALKQSGNADIRKSKSLHEYDYNYFQW